MNRAADALEASIHQAHSARFPWELLIVIIGSSYIAAALVTWARMGFRVAG